MFKKFITRLLTVMVALFSGATAYEVGDTLTVIQMPLHNIPSIVIPGDTLDITCDAVSNTSGWKASLVHGNKKVNLSLFDQSFDTDFNYWRLKTKIPAVEVYELYHLVVTADGGIVDTSRQCVQVISSRKKDYYFIHITDTHLASHKYYTDAGHEGDSSEMNDLRAVIDDINLLNPEFVLLTGDIVNEGELETPFTDNGKFHDHRYYSRAQRLLWECKVPVFLISGNHDINGWDPTPPPDGTARKTWWRFYGWKHLENPPSSAPYYTQNYSFDYGDIHFIGMESYENDDGWNSSIYGRTSFTSGQMDWLTKDLASVPANKEKVLFIHYDFKNEINLVDRGMDGMVSGHTHKASANNKIPFRVGSNRTCDDKRFFRILRVANGKLAVDPNELYSSGPGKGTKVTVDFSPSNSGTAQEVTATVTNGINAPFENGRLKFYMPESSKPATITGGTIFQKDASDIQHVYYVDVDIPAGSSIDVTLSVDTTTAIAGPLPCSGVKKEIAIKKITRNNMTVSVLNGGVYTISLYSPQGRVLDRKRQQFLRSGTHSVAWTKGTVARGVAVVEIISGTYKISGKYIL